jgi:hypothetical protein
MGSILFNSNSTGTLNPDKLFFLNPFVCWYVKLGQQIRKSALSWKQSFQTVPIQLCPNPEFHSLISIVEFFLISMLLHYIFDSYHCTDL